jgi:4-hydroxy-tetrahydrodipicolinate reductase
MDGPIRVALCGAGGRMGGEIAAAVAAASDLALTAAIERPGHARLGETLEGVPLVAGLHPAIAGAQVLVDFTAPAATAELARAAAAAGAALLSGATGLAAGDHEALAQAAARIPVLHAPNMSPGIALLTRLVRAAAAALPGYDIEIVEMHHRGKQDAPSGTALALVEAIEGVRPGLKRLAGRSGHTGERGAGEIGIHALRGGDVVGEHEVILAGAGERIKLGHCAESRAAFVTGVLRAIRFLPGRPPGRYTMEDVLGLPG